MTTVGDAGNGARDLAPAAPPPQSAGLEGLRSAYRGSPPAPALRESLTAVIRAIEALSSTGVLGSVLLLDEDGVHLRHGAAPSLPTEFVEAIDGSRIGPAAGSCGTAAHRREAVIVDDIANDPLWADYRHLARAAGLGACWSTPIFSADGDLLGTFAMYYRTPREPTPSDLSLIGLFVRTVALTIEQVRDDHLLRMTLADLKRTHDDLRFILEVTTAAAGIHDMDEMLAALAGRAVGRLADTCIVDVLEQGALRRAAFASRTALPHSDVSAGVARYTPDLASAHPVAAAARTARVVQGADFAGAVAGAGPVVDHLRRLDPAAYLCLPLTARGATLGVLTLLAPAKADGFDGADTALANDLAGRIAVLLESSARYVAARAAEDRLRILARAGEVLTGSLRVDAVLDHLVELAVPGIGDVCEVHLIDDDGTTVRSASSERAGPEVVTAASLPAVAAKAMRRGTTVTLEPGDAGLETALGPGRSGSPLWVTACPLLADGEPIGVLTVAGHEAPTTKREVLPLLAARGALALDNARRLARERTVAETLQRSLLPRQLPVVQGLELGACYHAGARGAEVGGDWYDVLRYPDGRTGLVMGDVVGRGIAAAVVMGTLRNALQAFAVQNLGPGQALDLLNRLVRDEEGPIATVLFGVFDPTSHRLTYASAGHLPALAVDAEAATWLEHAVGPPVGVPFPGSYSEHDIELRPGTTLVLYTDGLVERRDRDLAEGLGALQDAVRALVQGPPGTPSDVCDRLVELLVGEDPDADDIAVMAALAT